MFQKIISVCSAFCQLFGLSDLVNKKVYPRSVKWVIFRIITTYIMPAAGISLTFYYIIEKSQSPSKTTFFVNISILLFEVADACFFLIISNKREINLYNLLLKIEDCDLGEIISVRPCQIEMRKYIFIIVYNTFSFMTVLLSFHMCNLDAGISFLAYCNSIYVLLCFFATTITNVALTIKLQHKINGINKYFQSMNNTQLKNIVNDQDLIKNLEKLSIKFHIAVDTTKNFSKNYFFGCVVYCIFQPLWSLYYFIINFEDLPLYSKLFLTIWSLIHIFNTNEWIWVTTSLHKEVFQLHKNFFTVAMRFPNSYINKMVTNRAVTLFNIKLSDSLYDYIPIDWTLNTWIFTTIISFQTIILQFRFQEAITMVI